MTNTFDRVESLIADLGFKPDPGFSGYPSLYNERGDAVLVLALEGHELHIQLYRTDGPGTDFELLRTEESSLRPEWGEYGPVTAERRIRELAEMVLPRTHLLS